MKKTINTALRSNFLFYISDGNVIETNEENVFSNQLSNYSDKCKGWFQLYRYFIKQTS